MNHEIETSDDTRLAGDDLIHQLKNNIQLQLLICSNLRQQLIRINDPHCLELMDQLDEINQQIVDCGMPQKDERLE